MKNRRVEYLSACIMLGWSLILALPGNTISGTDAFSSFLERGWTEVQLATVLGIVGTMWVFALLVSGHHRRSPVFRCLGAISGTIMWAHITFMLVEHSLRHDAWSTGVAVYGIIALFDLFSSYRSAADAYHAHIQGRFFDRLAIRDDP